MNLLPTWLTTAIFFSFLNYCSEKMQTAIELCFFLGGGGGGPRGVLGNLKVVYGNEYRVMINYSSK